MNEHVGAEKTFSGKLKKFKDQGYITSQHAGLIEEVLDAGHAAIHRAYFPSEEDLRTCVDVVKHLMHGIYILHPKVQLLSENTPARPKKSLEDDK